MKYIPKISSAIIVGFFSIVFGSLLLLRLLNFFTLPKLVDETLIWGCAIFSILGGLHHLYVHVKHKAIKSMI